jgi:hypothetical protein
MALADLQKWLVPLCIGGALALGGYGGSTGSPNQAGSHLGMLTGMAGECSGPAGEPTRPVQVIVSRDRHVVVKQTALGTHPFTFSLPAGTYTVTTDQSYAVPVTVGLNSAHVAHADVWSACD